MSKTKDLMGWWWWQEKKWGSGKDWMRCERKKGCLVGCGSGLCRRKSRGEVWSSARSVGPGALWVCVLGGQEWARRSGRRHRYGHWEESETLLVWHGVVQPRLSAENPRAQEGFSRPTATVTARQIEKDRASAGGCG